MKENVKAYLLVAPRLKLMALWLRRVLAPLLVILQVFHVFRYIPFIRDWLAYRKSGGVAAVSDWYPCLLDNTSVTGFDPHYFYQSAWVMKLLAEARPEHHVDVGSDVRFVGMLPAITTVTFIDIRPLEVTLDHFDSKAGSVLDLPYDDESLSSMSCLHVIEHIGLGRYGDPLDPEGSRKACVELSRVLAVGGVLYISVPIGCSRVQFNGQRVFDASEVIKMFDGLTLQRLAMVDANGAFIEGIEVESCVLGVKDWGDFGLGIFVFEKHLRLIDEAIQQHVCA